MPRSLGTALIGISPTGGKAFGVDVRKLVDSATKGVSASVPVTLDSAKARLSATALKAQLEELTGRASMIKLSADDKPALAALLGVSARLDGLDKRVVSPKLTLAGRERMLAQITELDLALDKLESKAGAAGAEAGAASASFGDLGGSGFTALIAGGVALAPVLATLGLGLGGLGLAATQTAKNTQVMGSVLAPLKTEFAAFSASLQPEVLAAFGQGVSIATGLLHDIQPVAAATGKALDGVLGQVGAEFASGEWQKFFAFMAQTAGPDLQLVGKLFVDLAADVPPLLEALQPAARAVLVLADDVAVLIGAAGKLHILLPLLGAAVGALVAGPMGALVGAAVGGGLAIGAMSDHATKAAPLVERLGTSTETVTAAVARFGPSAGSWTTAVTATGTQAQITAAHVETLAQQVTDLTTAETNGLNPLLAYTNALIAQSGDAAALKTALAASGGQVGLNTAAQRASFGAAQQYISDLETTAKQAAASGQGIGAQISALQTALPLLESAKGGTRQYWQEVKTLAAWLAQLEKMKPVHETIVVDGSGNWAFGQSNARFHAATGMLVPGGYGGGDRVHILAEPGEAIVPKHLVSGVAPYLAAHKVPGFAGGGLVPSYSGALDGLQPWATANLATTATLITDAIAKAMANAANAAAAAAPGAAGPGGGAPSANAALARKLMPAWAGGAEWAAWNYVAMRESGWNQFARNPSSGAYGIPQALPPSKMGAAANPPQSNPSAQISWMIGYIRSVYRDPIGAAAHERNLNWYANGTLSALPGWAVVGERGPELMHLGGGEQIIPGGALPGHLDDLAGAVTGLTAALSPIAAASLAAGGFGLTRTDLALPPPPSTDSTSTGGDTTGGDTGTGDDGTGTGAPATPKPAPKPHANSVQRLAAVPVRRLMASYIRTNHLAQMKEAKVTLDYLMDHSYDAKMGQVEFLDTLLAAAQKKKDKKAEAAAVRLLAAQGVHSAKIQASAKGDVPRDTAHKTVDKLMRDYISQNDMVNATAANVLLRHWSETKFTAPIAQITKLDTLLARYRKAKDTPDVKATEALLHNYGVRKFAAGGVIREPVAGLGMRSGQPYLFGERGPETVTPGGGGDIVGELRGLRAELKALRGQTDRLTQVTAASPQRTGHHVAAAMVGGSASIAMSARYPRAWG